LSLEVVENYVGTPELHWSARSGQQENRAQDAEKVHQRRSRIAQRLNVSKRTPRLFARCGLAGRTFSWFAQARSNP